jgi:hypothetical protein
MQARKRFFLCSARKENSNGWGYEMIYSKSGLAEAGAVYTTSFKGEEDTVWIVTIHDPVINKIEFVRVTSKSNGKYTSILHMFWNAIFTAVGINSSKNTLSLYLPFNVCLNTKYFIAVLRLYL